MPYEALLRDRKIQLQEPNPTSIQRLLKISYRDLQAASKFIDIDPDWAYTAAYNSILQACRALMFSQGYRPRGGEQHFIVIQFITEGLGEEFTHQIHLFDQRRRKRHRLIYEMTGLVQRKEVEQVIAFAEDFIQKIIERISGQNRLI